MRSGLSMGKQPQIVEIKMAAVEAMVERAKGLQAQSSSVRGSVTGPCVLMR